MMNEQMTDQLQAAYAHPNRKFCYYSGKNDPAVGRTLGLEQWDWTPQPTVNIEPYFWNTHTIALGMGCQPKTTSEGKEWIEPLVHSPVGQYHISRVALGV